jgi:putative membrane protein
MTRSICQRAILWAVAFPALAMQTQSVSAHGGEHEHGQRQIAGPRNWSELWRAWEFEPGVVLPLAISAALYGYGLSRFWREAGVGRGIRAGEAACFWLGWLALVVALVSPVHPWGSVLFSAHMTQHEILMLIAAPLLVLGKPLVAMLRALPSGWARRLVTWTSVRWWRAVWGIVSNAFAAWLIHAAILWMWHIPALFQATLGNELVHAAQHLSFVLSALLFWWAVMQGPHRALNYGVAVLYLFTTALHSGVLGALITFSGRLWYPAYASTTGSWGLTPLEDQQLGGLIMWVPACLVYIFAGLALFAGWMRASEERVVRWEQRQAAPALADRG